MKIFISWSGPMSREIAEALRGWLPSVLQTVEPYVSSEDIDKGARWSVDISRELEDSDYGILCVTADNVKAPWLNFEAGALSKSFDKSRVSPFLFGMSKSEVTGPLVQFQSTIYEHDDVHKLVKSINSASEVPLEEARLNAAFAVWWPMLKESMDNVKDPSDESGWEVSDRSVPDMVVEILELMRAQQKTLSEIMDGPLAAAGEPPFDVNSIVATVVLIQAVVERGMKTENIKTAEGEQLRLALRSIVSILAPRMSSNEYDKRLRTAEAALKALEDPDNIAKIANLTHMRWLNPGVRGPEK